jgi:hypothetical protein
MTNTTRAIPATFSQQSQAVLVYDMTTLDVSRVHHSAVHRVEDRTLFPFLTSQDEPICSILQNLVTGRQADWEALRLRGFRSLVGHVCLPFAVDPKLEEFAGNAS